MKKRPEAPFLPLEQISEGNVWLCMGIDGKLGAYRVWDEWRLTHDHHVWKYEHRTYFSEATHKKLDLEKYEKKYAGLLQ